jgi:hypothetical protein
MSAPTYPPARAVAAKVVEHFAKDMGAARVDGTEAALLPDAHAIEAMVETAFWTSLRREEGYSPRISLAFVAPNPARPAMNFERPLPLDPGALTRLAPAVERPGIHLAVFAGPSGLHVWGATRKLPAYSFVLEVIAPGLLVIKHSRSEDTGKFVNIAVIQGDQIKIVEQSTGLLPDCPALLISLLGLDASTSNDSVNVLIELAVSMRAHGRGGALLVVPSESTTWLESFVQPITYSVAPPFSSLADLIRDGPGQAPPRRWEDALRRAIATVAGLTAVDGATVITNRYDLLAFGAKIIRRWLQPPVAQVVHTEPIAGAAPEVVDVVRLGGTRHLSAAQFAQDQHDAIALVASQDGRFTVMQWSQCKQKVHAHRIESLLL